MTATREIWRASIPPFGGLELFPDPPMARHRTPPHFGRACCCAKERPRQRPNPPAFLHDHSDHGGLDKAAQRGRGDHREFKVTATGRRTRERLKEERSSTPSLCRTYPGPLLRPMTTMAAARSSSDAVVHADEWIVARRPVGCYSSFPPARINKDHTELEAKDHRAGFSWPSPWPRTDSRNAPMIFYRQRYVRSSNDDDDDVTPGNRSSDDDAEWFVHTASHSIVHSIVASPHLASAAPLLFSGWL
jgi:hypothetical protein